MPKISVIMPVYKVERYLPAAIESITTQDYEDFELILVDDCSQDGCAAICDDYAAKDSRVKVLHKPENEGLSKARNSGMAMAAGEYLMFVDSDDILSPGALKKVRDTLKSDTEILVFGVTRFYENKSGRTTKIEKLQCEEIQDASIHDSGEIFLKLTDAHLFPFAWNKVYKRDFLIKSGVKFEDTKLIEDFLFNIALFAKSEKITVIPDCLYNYRKPKHETLVSAYTPEFYDLTKRKFRLESEFLALTGQESFEAKQTVLYSHIKHIISVFIRNRSKSAGLSVKQQKQKIWEILNDSTTLSVMQQYVPRGIVAKSVCFPIRHKMANCCYILAGLISLVKRR